MGTRNGLRDVLQLLPRVRHAFAYGSAVHLQPGLYAPERAQQQLVDFIMAVDDTDAWHKQNIERNRSHYSCLAAFGPRAVLFNADQIGAGVHFNTAIPWGKQKPVLELQQDAQVSSALQQNLKSALTASLLMLPPSFSREELFSTIVGLSYLGDIRMGFAEDSRKVQRIVAGSFQGLQRMYIPLMQGFKGLAVSVKATSMSPLWHQDMQPECRLHLLSRLPAGVLRGLGTAQGMQLPDTLDRMAIAERVIERGREGRAVRSAIARIVRASSRQQALAGLLMAGIPASVRYLWQKMSKAWHPAGTIR
ncbi:hypothetical protein WJX73_002444 [Symbiochloris irregularis]|uniref:Phosphatidate cytidylyltransferase, mitochondrial n=1 Tax=Symbiochloris irregularis TaxID=706552 RepID=A0AAW1NP07_9CHLO